MSGETVSVETPFAAAGPELGDIHDGEEEGLFESEADDGDVIEETDETTEDIDSNADTDDEAEEETDETSEDSDSDELETAKSEVEALTAEGDAAATLLAKHDIDYSGLCAEYRENGELSDKSVAALEKAGFTRDLVQSYIEGQQLRYYTGYVLPIKKAAGGEEAYAELCDWAAANLNEKEQARFNKAVESNDIDIAITAVENLLNRKEKAVGKKPELVQGRTAKPSPGIRGFTSLEEMAAAMDDPRYEVDMEYTKKVERRMLASDF